MNQNELTHYGVLGMKWGVRRAQTQADRVAKRVEKLKAKKKEQDKLTRAKNKLSKLQEEEKSLKSKLKNKPEKGEKEKKIGQGKTKPVKKKKISEMSDEELNSVIERIRLEQRYKELVAPSNTEAKKKIFDGRSFMSKLTQQTAEDLGVQVTKYYGAKLINNLIGDENAVYANNKKKS